MLVSDVFEVPHEKLADWIALAGAAVAYFILALAVFYGLRHVRMRLLGSVVAAIVLVVGLVGYFEVFVAIDHVTFRRAVIDALGQTPASGNDALLDRLTDERSRSIRQEGGPIDLRRIGFYCLPVIAAALAAILAKARRAPSA